MTKRPALELVVSPRAEIDPLTFSAATLALLAHRAQARRLPQTATTFDRLARLRRMMEGSGIRYRDAATGRMMRGSDGP